MFRVGTQIHQDLMELGGISQYSAAVGIKAWPNLDRGGQRGAEQQQGFFDQRV